MSFWIQHQNTSEGTLRLHSKTRDRKYAMRRLKELTNQYPQDMFMLYPLGVCTTPIAVGYKKEVEIRQTVN